MPRFRKVLRRSAVAACTVFVATALSNPAAWGQGTGTGLGASHAVIDPVDPETVYVASTLYGVFKSADGGAHWRLLNRGVGASDFYALAVHPQDPRIVLIGAAGGGIYRSTDGGEEFVDASQGLFDTSVYDLVFDTRDARIVYALTLREVFRSTDTGLTWAPLFQANASIVDSSFHRRLAVLPTTPTVLFIATGNAAFRRAEGEASWTTLGSALAGAKVTTFAYDQGTKTLYAGGAFAEGLYRSGDAGATWSLVGGGLKPAWVQRLALDPRNPRVVYAATKNRGMLKSEDGGATWREINEGLSEKDIKALALHPEDSARLVIATYGRGIFTSEDGGLRWEHRPVPPYPSWEEVYASLTRKVQARGPASPPPAAFGKCQGCHGWTDPVLNGPTKQTFWRVFPSHRDWRPAIERMRAPAQLSGSDESEVLAYLNRYYGVSPAAPFAGERVVTLPVFSGKDCFPTNVIAADLNVDGRLDLVVTGFCNRFAVLLAAPERPGAFMPAREVSVPTSAIGIAVVPTTPGRPPLIVVSNCANPDAIARQPLLHVVSADTWEVIATQPSGGIAPDDIAVADFNGDGRPDLAVGHWKGGVLSVLLGEGRDGAFHVPGEGTAQRLTVGDEHWQVLARDFDRDGAVDVAVPVWAFGPAGERDRTAQLAFFKGDGRGGLSAQPLSAAAIDPEARSIAAADFDGNGTLDLAVANPGSGVREDGNVRVLFGDGRGGFAPREESDIKGLLAPQGIAAADVDGDGRPDIAVASRPVGRGTEVTVLLNDGTGRFARERGQVVPLGAKAAVSPLSFQPLTAADLDRNGAVDLVVANNGAGTVSILFNGLTR